MSDWTTSQVVLWPANSASRCAAETLPRVRSRTVLMMMVTGWWSANALSQLGMVDVGTNALLANVSGKTTGNVAALTAWELLAYRPMRANRNDVASVKSSSRAK